LNTSCTAPDGLKHARPLAKLRECDLVVPHDPHAAAGYRDEAVVVLLAIDPGVPRRRKAVTCHSRSRVFGLSIGLFEHVHLASQQLGEV